MGARLSDAEAVQEADQANEQLGAFYGTILPKWQALREQLAKGERSGAEKQIPSGPFFTQVTPAYYQARQRLVFVGQESHGWIEAPDAVSVERIRAHYMKWRLKLLSPSGSTSSMSPYWQAIRQVRAKLAAGEPPESLMFANVLPCDINKKRPPKELYERLRSWKVVAKELEVLTPDAVIFFCGSYSLQPFFGVEPPPLSLANPFVPYRPPGASWKGIVTYHPNFLRRKKLWGVLDQIVDQLRPAGVTA
jgi:hypothetical protein